ncbi:MAG: type I-E CRISPR-associated protein Cas6/Cse3/CasE [Magnetococcales bacterium]|nr:type I-E CRISPR-associated protein Cas6/Cse3/CasE [Magnetococcales bacterium]
MYFSQLTLDQSRLRLGWSGEYGLHKMVWNLFAGQADQPRDFLFHLNENGLSSILYTLSRREPQITDTPWQARTKPFAPQLATGDQLGFLLRANPVVTRAKKRHDVVMDAKHTLSSQGKPRKEWPSQAELVQQTASAWLRRRADSMGVEWGEICAEGYQIRRFSKPNKSTISLATVDFSGVLTVRQPQLFHEAVITGVGGAKGFGCGLMMLRRL